MFLGKERPSIPALFSEYDSTCTRPTDLQLFHNSLLYLLFAISRIYYARQHLTNIGDQGGLFIAS